MGCDVCARGECTEETMAVISRDDLFEDLNSFWDSFTVFLELYIVQEKVVHVPVALVCTQTTDFIRGEVL